MGRHIGNRPSGNLKFSAFPVQNPEIQWYYSTPFLDGFDIDGARDDIDGSTFSHKPFPVDNYASGDASTWNKDDTLLVHNPSITIAPKSSVIDIDRLNQTPENIRSSTATYNGPAIIQNNGCTFWWVDRGYTEPTTSLQYIRCFTYYGTGGTTTDTPGEDFSGLSSTAFRNLMFLFRTSTGSVFNEIRLPSLGSLNGSSAKLPRCGAYNDTYAHVLNIYIATIDWTGSAYSTVTGITPNANMIKISHWGGGDGILSLPLTQRYNYNYQSTDTTSFDTMFFKNSINTARTYILDEDYFFHDDVPDRDIYLCETGFSNRPWTAQEHLDLKTYLLEKYNT